MALIADSLIPTIVGRIMMLREWMPPACCCLHPKGIADKGYYHYKPEKSVYYGRNTCEQVYGRFQDAVKLWGTIMGHEYSC